MPLGRPTSNNYRQKLSVDAKVSKKCDEKWSICLVSVDFPIRSSLITKGKIIASWWRNLTDTSLSSDQFISLSKTLTSCTLCTEKGTVSFLIFLPKMYNLNLTMKKY